MKKIILVILLLFNINFALGKEIPEGAIVKVYPRKPISSINYQIGDFVYFINTVDMWQGSNILIPKSTVFTGYIDSLTMPVQGVNASMSIKINKIIFPNKETHQIKADITCNGQKILGGEQTSPASYTKAIHYLSPARGFTQWVPSGEYLFGSHITIDQKNELFVTFEEKLILKD